MSGYVWDNLGGVEDREPVDNNDDGIKLLVLTDRHDSGTLYSMHRCLLVPEILGHIFSDIYLCGTEGGLQHYWNHYSHQPRAERRVARRFLATLSRVCRSFRDVALDVLWAELESLEPLFICLPEDLWSRTEDWMIVLQRPVTKADLSIFERYASRVQVLGDTNSNLFEYIDAEFIHAIMGISSQSLLLPNLRALCCGGCPSDLQSYMRHFLGPELVCLRLDLDLEWSRERFWTRVMSSVMSGLDRHSPRLKVLHLRDAPSQVSEVALCGLPHLREVSITLLDDKPFQCRTSTLDVLDIYSSTLTLCRNMVEEWVVPCRRLYFYFDIPETADAVERAMCELCNRVLSDGLEEFRHYAPKNVDNIDYAFNLRTFIPLMRFSNLKIVKLAPFCMSLLDDDALGSIAKSWPYLEELNLGTRYFWKTRPRITFHGLVAVLSSCLNLKALGLVFDATKLDPPAAEKPGGGISNTNVTTFHVGCSPIEEPLHVAVALSAILPCLTKINVEFTTWPLEGPDRDLRSAKWGEVLKCISIYTLIRKQEGLRI